MSQRVILRPGFGVRELIEEEIGETPGGGGVSDYNDLTNLPVIPVDLPAGVISVAALDTLVDDVPVGGGTLEFGPGAFRLDGRWQIRRSDVQIKGAGRNKTYLLFDDIADPTNNYIIQFIGTAEAPLLNVGLSDLTIDAREWDNGEGKLNAGTVTMLAKYNVVITGTGGTWTFTIDGNSASGIAYNAATATVQTAIEGISGVGSGNVSVTGSAGNYVIEFQGALADTVLYVTATDSALSGTGHKVDVYAYVTLDTGSSAANDYYNNVWWTPVEDSGNTAAEGNQALIVDYVGATREAKFAQWSSAQRPTTGAFYGIMLPGNQMSYGVGRVGFTYCQDFLVDMVSGYGGHGKLDYYGCKWGIINGVHIEHTVENAINGLTTGVSANNNQYITINDFHLNRVGEGIDCVMADFTISNGIIKLWGVQDEGLDLNTSQNGVVENLVIIGGDHSINLHGSTNSGDIALGSSYNIRINNVVGHDFTSGGLSILYGASDGTVQAATHGTIKNIFISNCSFISAVAGANGMELGWTNTAFPVYVDYVTVNNCYVDVPGVACAAPFNRKTRVLNSRLISSAGVELYANHSSYVTEDLTVEGCYVEGAGASTTTGAAIYINRCLRPTIRNCRLKGITQGYGALISNTDSPVFEGNELLTSVSHGIIIDWGVTNQVGADAHLNARIRRNLIKDWGSGVSGRFGLQLNCNLTTGGPYKGWDVSENMLTLPTVSYNGHKGIVINAGSAGLTRGKIAGNYVTDSITTNVNRIDLSDTDLTAPIKCFGNSPEVSIIGAKTADYALTIGDSGELWTNAGASGLIHYTLPGAIKGLKYRFYVAANQFLRVKPQSGQTLTNTSGVPMGTAEYIYSDIIGNFIQYEAVSGTEWVCVGYAGTWTEQTP